MHNFVRSSHGRACISVREDEIASESMGINTTKYKTLAFVIGAILASIAGALYASYFYVLKPSTFGFMKSIDILVIVVFGGMGSLSGSIFAAIVLGLINLFLQRDVYKRQGEGNSLETVNKTKEIVCDILEKDFKISAILACNDLMGIGSMKACKKLNKKIGKDISIIGFDNIELCQMIEPNLTTMDQNMYLLGSNASMLLQDIIEHKAYKRIMLENILVERETVGMKAKSD